MMLSVKQKVFNYLAKSQKTELCLVLSKLVKRKMAEAEKEPSDSEIADFYIEDEEYYLKQGTSKNSWIEEVLFEDYFYKDLILYIKECKTKLKIKEAQKPLYEKQKQFQKEQRKKLSELKMSKEPATKAQIRYYKALCEKYNIEKINLAEASKLSLKQEISKILEEHDEKNLLLKKLEELKREN